MRRGMAQVSSRSVRPEALEGWERTSALGLTDGGGGLDLVHVGDLEIFPVSDALHDRVLESGIG